VNIYIIDDLNNNLQGIIQLFKRVEGCEVECRSGGRLFPGEIIRWLEKFFLTSNLAIGCTRLRVFSV